MKKREKKKKKEKKKEKNKKKRKDENKDSPCSHKNFQVPIRERYISRSIIKFVYLSIHHISTHMHILI
jgi:hypothetical protein